MVTIPVAIEPEIAAKLRERAAVSGREVGDYAADLLRRSVTAPTLDEILQPVRDDFSRSGMSDDELMALGRRELEALRTEKNQNPI